MKDEHLPKNYKDHGNWRVALIAEFVEYILDIHKAHPNYGILDNLPERIIKVFINPSAEEKHAR